VRILGYEVSFVKAAPPNLSPPMSTTGGWWPIVREPFPGAWQRNSELRVDTALSNVVVFRCVALISSDIAKLRVRLVEQKESGIWVETTSPAFSPVLTRPCPWQTSVQFWEQWISCKLNWGNTYALKERDNRQVVVALYLLDPQRVKPLIAPNGDIFYELQTDYLAGLGKSVIVPASEIIHDRMCAWFHPLVGLPPLYAAGLAASQGLKIQNHSNAFFANGAQPGGILTAPGRIPPEKAKEIKEKWQDGFTGNNVGKVAVLGDGLAYQAMAVNADDSQLIEQWKLTAEMICAAYGVPPYKLGFGERSRGLSVEALDQQYYSQTLQYHIESAEACLDDGLRLPANYGSEFDLEGLLRMDTAAKVKAIADAVGAGVMKPNEGRAKLGYAPVPGGDTPYLQVQNYSLAALDRRDQNEPAPGSAGGPSATPAQPDPAPPPDDGEPLDDGEGSADDTQARHLRLVRATLAASVKHARLLAPT
jgi:HK97 family phage portal protein